MTFRYFSVTFATASLMGEEKGPITASTRDREEGAEDAEWFQGQREPPPRA